MENFREEMFKEIGAQLKNARLCKGISQRDLANNISSTQTVIYNTENSKVTPSLSTLLKICEVLDLRLNLTYSDGSKIKAPLLNSKERALLQPLADYCKMFANDKKVVLYRNDIGDEFIFYAIDGDNDISILTIAINKDDYPNVLADNDYQLSDLGL